MYICKQLPAFQRSEMPPSSGTKKSKKSDRYHVQRNAMEVLSQWKGGNVQQVGG